MEPRRTARAGDQGPRGPERPHHGIAPEHRRRFLTVTVIAVLVTVAAVTGGPWVWTRLVEAPAPPPLELTSPTATVPAATPDPDPDGAWTVTEGSEAGYRIGEVLTGEQVEVVGRTEQVTGTATVTDGQLTAAQVTVDASTLTTDQSARDLYVTRALNTSVHQHATFELSGAVDVSALATSTGPVTVQAPGRLTIAGVQLDVVAELEVQHVDGGLEVAGRVPVALADLGLTAPDLGFVTVEPTGAVEILLVLAR